MKTPQFNKNIRKMVSSAIESIRAHSRVIGIMSVLVGFGIIIYSVSSPSLQLLSKFTQPKITPQNAATSWASTTDNPYRGRLSPEFANRLDALTLAILRKGANMNEPQFRYYLANLSTGIQLIGNKSEYKSIEEVQNILNFLIYEINATSKALSSNGSSAIEEIANIINTTSIPISARDSLSIGVTDISGNTRNSFNIGDTMVISITGTDTGNTYFCLGLPGQDSSCSGSANFKKIGGNGDGWVKINGSRLDFPNLVLSADAVGIGTYTLSVKSGVNGTPVSLPVPINKIQVSKYEVSTIKDIVYKGSQKLDVYLPKNRTTKIPVYIVVHGGGWDSGDKEMYSYMSKYYTDQGIAYIPIDYTLASSSRAIVESVYKEIDCSLKWVNYNINTYNFDTSKINILGISAGGHLALQYALNQSSYNDSSCQWGGRQVALNQVVGIQAPTDLTLDLTQTGWGDATYLVENFIGKKRQSTDFMTKARENSPINFIKKDNTSAKYYLFHGKKDDIVNYNTHAIPLYNKLRDNNYSVVFDSSENTGHDTIGLTPELYSRIFSQMKSEN